MGGRKRVVKHGKSMYDNHRCRCVVCRKAHRKYLDVERAKRHAAKLSDGRVSGRRESPLMRQEYDSLTRGEYLRLQESTPGVRKAQRRKGVVG
jgi:hypothetical protein